MKAVKAIRGMVIAACLIISSQSVYAQIQCTLIRERTQTPPVFGMSGKLENTNTWITPLCLRRDDGAGSSKIVRLDKGVMWVVNHTDSSYTELTKDAYQGMALMSLMLYGVTYDTVTGDVIIPDPLFRKTGRQANINSFTCFEVVPAKIDKDNTLFKGVNLWISKDTGVDPSLFADILRKTMGGIGEDYEPFFRQIEELGGYPVRVETKVLGKVVTQNFLSQKKVTVKSGFFDLPRGYRKKEGFFGPF